MEISSSHLLHRFKVCNLIIQKGSPCHFFYFGHFWAVVPLSCNVGGDCQNSGHAHFDVVGGWAVLFSVPKHHFPTHTTLITSPRYEDKCWRVWSCILTCTRVLLTAKHGTLYVLAHFLHKCLSFCTWLNFGSHISPYPA